MSISLIVLAALAAAQLQPASAADTLLLRPDRVYDGAGAPHAGWQVVVRGGRIEAVGPAIAAPAGSRVIDLPGTTLMPGMIEGHGHLFLHPYNEAKWDAQVLNEPLALRTARAVVHARQTLEAGFTTERDLGTEGAGYADVGLRQAIDAGIVPGPHLVVATKAIVARGAYGPKGFEPGVEVPQGAEEASGVDEVVRAVRSQIAAGADVVKLYGRLSLARGRGQPADLFARRAEGGGRSGARRRAGRSRSTPRRPRACAGRSPRAPTRSSMAMAGPPRSSPR